MNRNFRFQIIRRTSPSVHRQLIPKTFLLRIIIIIPSRFAIKIPAKFHPIQKYFVIETKEPPLDSKSSVLLVNSIPRL